MSEEISSAMIFFRIVFPGVSIYGLLSQGAKFGSFRKFQKFTKNIDCKKIYFAYILQTSNIRFLGMQNSFLVHFFSI